MREKAQPCATVSASLLDGVDGKAALAMTALPSMAVGLEYETSPEEGPPSAVLRERVRERAVENGNQLALLAGRTLVLLAG